ncbi:MAG: glycosyltransferase [Alphaproteobacteria bacterium]|nr:MAG: glycosyltransferase [Alphaproteobacteria bacterium]
MRARRVYIGWDPRDGAAFAVCRHSLLAHASVTVEVRALRDWELRRRGVYWRAYHVDGRGQMWDARDGRPFSTGFSYTRFCVPLLEDYGADPVVFCDADMLWRADVAELFDLAGDSALACVKHEHRPHEREKMAGLIQTVYRRKNWSSLMVMRPERCVGLTPYAVNNMPRDWLHGMCWIDEGEVRGLPEAWNWLDGWSDPGIDAKVVHFTRGTPDMPGTESVPHAREWHAALAAATGGCGCDMAACVPVSALSETR